MPEVNEKHCLTSLEQPVGSSVGHSRSMKMLECGDVCKELGHNVILLSTMFNSVNSFINEGAVNAPINRVSSIHKFLSLERAIAFSELFCE